jgi:DNA-binding MarR family transcriptional regulator
MFQCDLSEKEKLVLYNLIKYPFLNDREVSERIGMKISTLTSIKNRLRKGDFYRTIRIPHLSYIGYELMWVRYGTYNNVKNPEEIFQKEQEIIEESALNTFYAVQDGHSFFSLNISRDYTEAQTQIKTVEKEFQALEYIERFNYIFLPFELTINLFDFDYSLLLKNTFGIEDEWMFTLPGILDTTGTLKDLRKNDVRILQSLIRNPELPDTAIANEINATRQAVSRLRKKFEKEGVIRTVRVPNLKNLGYELFVFSHQSHSPNLVNRDMVGDIEAYIDTIPLVYVNSTDLESFGLSVFSDFYEFQKMKETLISKILRAGFITDTPEFILFSVPNMKMIKDLDFSRLEF